MVRMLRQGLLVSLCLTCVWSVHVYHTSVETVDKESATRLYEVRWFNQSLDHFTFTTKATFKQKYLVNNTFWDR